MPWTECQFLGEDSLQKKAETQPASRVDLGQGRRLVTIGETTVCLVVAWNGLEEPSFDDPGKGS